MIIAIIFNRQSLQLENLNFLKIWHHAFALHIEYIVNGIEETTLNPSVVGDASACQFGKWASSASDKLADHPKFRELLAAHNQFHMVAGKIMQLYVDGNYLEAKQQSDALPKLSAFVAAAIDSLDERLRTERADFSADSIRFQSHDTESTWDDSLLLGISILDQQHKSIAKLADEFLLTPSELLSSERGTILINNLQSLLFMHFETEELFMARNRISEDEFAAHKAEHDQIINKLATFSYDLALSNVNMTFRETHSLLIESVIDHVVTFDMDIKEYGGIGCRISGAN